MKVGDPVWLEHPYRKQREQYRIDEETSRSWVVHGHGHILCKIPKTFAGDSWSIPNNYGSMRLWLNRFAMEESDWVSKNSTKIIDAVRRLDRDPKTLRAIATLIGYKEES